MDSQPNDEDAPEETKQESPATDVQPLQYVDDDDEDERDEEDLEETE